ncbi:MAG: FAD-linked oxidase C-terminal domain-containing protein [Kiloniellales bacterium]|nr:FAD-linked oxidase C-terminal domain-containing protein [Kiloniellales bacterium]
MSTAALGTAARKPNRDRIGDPALAARLRGALEGEVLFDAFSRGRYATDASHYQIEPIGVVVPKTEADVLAAIEIAREEGVPLLPRGGGTSQCGQTVGRCLVLDTSKYLNRILEFDPEKREVTVEPGLVLDRLNASLRPEGLLFAVDISTGSRATLGGMAGNNSCGARSIRYGKMVDNVKAISAVLSDGTRHDFGPLAEPLPNDPLAARALGIAEGAAAAMEARFPKLQRRVGGYNLDRLLDGPGNMAQLLVGSEGSLGFFTKLTLGLHPIPPNRVLGVCHFPRFYDAMAATRHIVALEPSAVELVDRKMIELARNIPLFREVVARTVRGEPDSLLLVEFAGEDRDRQVAKLKDLDALLGELGFPDAVVPVTEAEPQREIWEVRKAGLNIMMSMKGDGKPISFIEDCAVPLEDLAEYTDRLNGVFARHGTSGTWYAHASVGCLHVRPILNLKQEIEVRKLRAIAEEAFEMVRAYKGSHSGEHGDGLVRSEFHEAMFGREIVTAFEDLKDSFDPQGLFNPGKIVRAPKMDDRSLFRFGPDYEATPFEAALDWSDWGGFLGAVEMCNNNGACRKSDPGVMCPSYRVTRDEQHVTRGRANSLRLALTGQLGPGALTAPEMKETLSLCVSCKACKRECPTGVDMAQMKLEVLAQRRKTEAPSLRERLIAYLPRYAPWAARLAPLANLRDALPGAAALSESLLGLSSRRSLPRWRRDAFRVEEAEAAGTKDGRKVLLFADTFNTYFEPENARAALKLLQAGGYRVDVARPSNGGRPLCCGRTFLAAGLVEEAKAEARRLIAAVLPAARAGTPIVGLEPSCLFTLKDEIPSLLPEEDGAEVAAAARLLESFLVQEREAGRLDLQLRDRGATKALLHGHCHQKAFAVMSDVERCLEMVPGLEVTPIDSSCCGMAGSFGYEAEHYEVSQRMAERSLLPAVRQADPEAIIVADGTSCRQQICDGSGRNALHVARVLEAALEPQGESEHGAR